MRQGIFQGYPDGQGEEIMKTIRRLIRSIFHPMEDPTVYTCDYCGGTAHVDIYFYVKLCICQMCMKKAFDIILCKT